MRKFLLIIALLTTNYSLFSQNILITDADWDTLNPYNCLANPGPAANFFDSGNNSANYSDNENEIITICPDFSGGANKLGLTFGTNVGLTFNVDGTDSIYIYDGPNTSSPLLGVHNSVTDPTGFNHQSSFGVNPSGCLTIQFISDGATNGTGWDANVACLTLPQPFTAHMTAQSMGVGSDIISPADTGYADICFDDSLLFTANPIFPYSLQNTGHGYSQDTSNVTYEWHFSDGSSAMGRTAWFKPPARNGYVAELKITDSFGQVQIIQSKIRVSTIPRFGGVINNRDSVCVGDTTVIIGAVTSTDTAGVDPTSSSFQLGGSVAGLVYLPDGSGVNYTDTIDVSGFLPGQLVTAASDIDQFFVNMEHSYLGDLEMLLECPNGTQVPIINSYSPGIIPGGFNGAGTFLGNARDMNIGNPGTGMDYYFSTANATWGDMATEYGLGNTVPVTNPSVGNAMNPGGIYLPEQSFANFIGCPLNGKWSITVRDNLGTDDGYIFEWGVFFDPSINPNQETYAPVIDSAKWLTNATILPGNSTDTFIVVTSSTAGTQNYTFQVTDNFGCVYDTTVQVYFLPGPTVQGDDNACAGQYQITGTSSFDGGTWAYSGPGTATFIPNNAVENPLVTVDVNGTYTFTFSDNQCAMDSSFDIYFADSVFVDLTPASFCVGEDGVLDAASPVIEATYSWNTGASSPSIMVSDSGSYYVTVTGLCNSASDTTTITTVICDIIVPNVITPNGDGQNDMLVFEGLEHYPNSSLVVFNRWGTKIYESANYQNNWNPVDVSDGTYFFILTPGGVIEKDVISNSINILH